MRKCLLPEIVSINTLKVITKSGSENLVETISRLFSPEGIKKQKEIQELTFPITKKQKRVEVIILDYLEQLVKKSGGTDV